MLELPRDDGAAHAGGFGSLQPIEISACTPCHLFWFDKLESVRLTPKSVLEVFQFIGRAARPATR
jgi:hypothetical protein